MAPLRSRQAGFGYDKPVSPTGTPKFQHPRRGNESPQTKTGPNRDGNAKSARFVIRYLAECRFHYPQTVLLPRPVGRKPAVTGLAGSEITGMAEIWEMIP